MTIEKLEQYYGIASNIEAIDQQIRTMYNTVSSPMGKQSESHSSTPGNPVERAALRITQLKDNLQEEKGRLQMLQEEIEGWLLTVPDMELVSIIRWHYLLRLNWKQTNIKVYGYPSYDYARKRVSRYFENLSELSE